MHGVQEWRNWRNEFAWRYKMLQFWLRRKVLEDRALVGSREYRKLFQCRVPLRCYFDVCRLALFIVR